MKHSNINKTAMTLAWQLLKINQVMTSKAKGFSYFLSIAYKMLKNSKHFAHVLTGLKAIKDAMLFDERVTEQRYDQFIDVYLAISKLSYN